MLKPYQFLRSKEKDLSQVQQTKGQITGVISKDRVNFNPPLIFNNITRVPHDQDKAYSTDSSTLRQLQKEHFFKVRTILAKTFLFG